MYLGLQKYINNWKRLGFNDSDLTRPISDRLVDAMIAYGTADAIAARLNEHLDAGADYVPIRVLIAEQTTSRRDCTRRPLGLSRSGGADEPLQL